MGSWRPLDEESETEFNKKVTMQADAKTGLGLAVIEKQMEDAAKVLSFSTRKREEKRGEQERERRREGMTAGCTRPLERNVLRKPAKKARARHAVECSLMPGKALSKKTTFVRES